MYIHQHWFALIVMWIVFDYTNELIIKNLNLDFNIFLISITFIFYSFGCFNQLSYFSVTIKLR